MLRERMVQGEAAGRRRPDYGGFKRMGTYSKCDGKSWDFSI